MKSLLDESASLVEAVSCGLNFFIRSIKARKKDSKKNGPRFICFMSHTGSSVHYIAFRRNRRALVCVQCFSSLGLKCSLNLAQVDSTSVFGQHCIPACAKQTNCFLSSNTAL